MTLRIQKMMWVLFFHLISTSVLYWGFYNFFPLHWLQNIEWLWQEPLLKIEINNPALLAGNWSQLCATCKVLCFLLIVWLLAVKLINVLHTQTTHAHLSLHWIVSYTVLCCLFFRLSGLFEQNTVPPVIVVWNNLITIVLGYPIALARYFWMIFLFTSCVWLLIENFKPFNLSFT